MIADHRRNLGRVGKIETLPILQICPRPSQTIGDIYDFEFSLVGKIWDSRETVKSPIVWDFTQLMKRQEANSLDNNTWSELGEQKPTSQKGLLNFLTHVQLPLSKCTSTPKSFFIARAELFPC